MEAIRENSPSKSPASNTAATRFTFTLRWVEFVFLFALLPLLYVMDLVPFPMIPLLLVITAVLTAVLLADPGFQRRQLLNLPPLRDYWRYIAAPFALAVPLLTGLVWLFAPEHLFELPRQRTVLWAVILVFYPLFSVYPQELLYRTYFFHRYRAIFPSDRQLIWASALAFGYMHIVFENAIAVVLCILGGYLFARTYARTQSTAAVWLEHALYGCFIFTVGLGAYFYGGAPR